VEFDGQKYYLNWDIPKSVGKVLAFYGHVGVMLRALAYILSYGNEIDKVSKHAVLNARYLHNLLKDVLWDPYPSSPKMHEVVFSMQKTGISPTDLAKALLDRGFYAPTIYFPLVVKDALMIEPTETESPRTLRAFANAIKEILQQDPEEVKTSPKTTPVRRIKEAEANRKPTLRRRCSKNTNPLMHNSFSAKT